MTIKSLFGKVRDMFTTANGNNNGTTANVINNNDGQTTDGQSDNITPVVGTDIHRKPSDMPTPELTDGQGVVAPTTFADTANELANVLTKVNVYVPFYTDQLANVKTGTTDEQNTRDLLTFWQTQRDDVTARLAGLTDEQRQTVNDIVTARLAGLTDEQRDDLTTRDVDGSKHVVTLARGRYDEQLKTVDTANKLAKKERDNATAQRDELKRQRVNVARLAVVSGTANNNDLTTIARQDVDDDATDVLKSVCEKINGKRQKGRQLLKNATTVLKSISRVCKDMTNNDVWTNIVKFFQHYGVDVEKSDITPKIVKSENIHPFMLVPTVDGLKVCDPLSVGRTLRPLTSWTVEKLADVIVLNKYMNDENVSDERKEQHVLLLSAAVNALQKERDAKREKDMTNDRIKELADELADMLDVEKTPVFDMKKYIMLTNELADEKTKLRVQLAELAELAKLANDKKSDVLTDKKSDDVSGTIHNARTEKNGQTAKIDNDTANGQTDGQTVSQDNGTTSDIVPVSQDTTTTNGSTSDVATTTNGQTVSQDNGTTSDIVPVSQDTTTANGTTGTRANGRKKSNGSTSNGRKKSNGTTGTTARRTRTTASQNKETANGTTGTRANGRKKVVNG